MSAGRVERRLAAILAADVAGYSRLVGEDEEGTLAALRAVRRETIDPQIAEHRGRIVKTTGDGLLVEFQSVVDAVRCAAAWQAAVPANNAIAWRIGIHQGDIVVEDGDIFGDGVNVAARLEALAEPGGICVSARVQEDATGRLNLEFEDTGERCLKNIVRPVRVYRVRPAATTVAPATPQLALPDKPSIAVLPFDNMTGDPDQEYFVDGVVEEITTAISRLPWLFVIARNSSFTFKGRAVDVRQVARDLGVRYVLEGSVRKSGNRVRITGQLIDTSTGAHIWADRVDGLLDDVFELQDRVTSSVVGAIDPKLRLAEMARASRKPTESLTAYDLYLRAVACGYARTVESLAEAVKLTRRALELDPAYVPAMARLALSRCQQATRGGISRTGPEAEEGIRLARQVIAVSDDPDELRSAAIAISVLAGENETALAALDRAILLNPNCAGAFGGRALVLAFLNRPTEAVASGEQAMRLSPLDPGMYDCWIGLGLAHLTTGNYEAGLPWAERAQRVNGGLPMFRLSLSLYGYLDRQEDARECLLRLRKIVPDATIASLTASMPKGYSSAVAARLAEGWRKAGVPEG